MYVKKIKRKCSIRGCKCLESYALSLTREMGNSVIACKSCLEKALEAVENHTDDISVKRTEPISAAPLFFNQKALGLAEKKEETIAENLDTDEKIHEGEYNKGEDSEISENEIFKCEIRDKTFKTEQGLKKHTKTCAKQD